MSQPAEKSRLNAFTNVAAWYFANPPATWCVARHPSGWFVNAADGTYISVHPTKREAVANLTDGAHARDHYDTLDWYLGYSRDPDLRPLTEAERDAVAHVLSSPGSTAPYRRYKHGRPGENMNTPAVYG
jgi:hypothetical protein